MTRIQKIPKYQVWELGQVIHFFSSCSQRSSTSPQLSECLYWHRDPLLLASTLTSEEKQNPQMEVPVDTRLTTYTCIQPLFHPAVSWV